MSLSSSSKSNLLAIPVLVLCPEAATGDASGRRSDDDGGDETLSVLGWDISEEDGDCGSDLLSVVSLTGLGGTERSAVFASLIPRNSSCISFFLLLTEAARGFSGLPPAASGVVCSGSVGGGGLGGPLGGFRRLTGLSARMSLRMSSSMPSLSSPENWTRRRPLMAAL